MVTSIQQKQELFKAIWATAEDLRNSVDGWDFKSYVLGILFYRFISENMTAYINKLQAEAGVPGFDYANFSDEEAEEAREQMVNEKGFFILPSQLFCNVSVFPTISSEGDVMSNRASTASPVNITAPNIMLSKLA